MKRRNAHRSTGKSFVLLVSLVMILVVGVGGTIAFLMDSTDPLANIFNPSKVTTKVEETREGTTKSNVRIKNTGDTDAWIRAAIVVTWQDEDGNIYGEAPAETDYDMKLNLGNNAWIKGNDGFYYWYAPVAANGSETGALITSCTAEGAAPVEGFYLNVEIIGSGIQSKPASVFNNQWGTSSGLEVKDANTDNPYLG